MKPTKDGLGVAGGSGPQRGRVRQHIFAAVATMMLGAGLGGVPVLGAEDSSISNAQRELKRQQFYFGEITNKLDEPTKAAVRRFQIRHGMKVTGELDGATLAVLATREPRPSAATAPAADSQAEDDRPPARERSQTIVRDDVDILRELEAERPAIPPQRDGLQRSSSTPESTASTSTSTAEARPPRQVLPPQENGPRAGETAAERTLPPSPTRRELPTSHRAQESSEVAAVARQDGISRGEILETLDRFVESWHQRTPDQELSFYADSVNYFDQGKTAHATIARDQRNYYRRWPEREYTLVSKPEVVRASEDSATVRYRFRYELRNGAKSARGQAEHFLRLERAGDGLKVASVRERKVTD